MGTLKNPKVIWWKGVLFLAMGLTSAALLMLRHPELTTALLLSITIWAFCRAYYFAFYVIEKYVDPNYRFAGLTDFLRYAVGRSSNPAPEEDVKEP